MPVAHDHSLSAEVVRRRFSYDPLTGVFLNRQSGPRRVIGAVAGTLRPDGYWQLCIDGRHYMAHRLAWLYMTGRPAPIQVDHKDRVRSNNRWANLKAVTTAENANNTGKRSGSKVYTGVTKAKGGWRAQITVAGKAIDLGVYETEEEAGDAYDEAKYAARPIFAPPI